jgi:long-chain acyl-CoA synthetase
VLIRQCGAEGFRNISSRELFEQVRDLSLGLSALGVAAGDRVAIVSESRPEWTIADLAVLTAGAITVPVYPTLPDTQVEYILNDSGARLVVVSNEVQLRKIRAVRDRLPRLQMTLLVDVGADGPRAPAEASLADAIAKGHTRLMNENGLARIYRETAAAVKPDDLATLIYTSGTTGEPRGVMLTHANLVSNLVGSAAVLKVTDEDEALSFLPLSHAFERLVLYLYLYEGLSISFAESIETIGRDLMAVRPTIITGVPRIYEKLQARILDAAAHGSAVSRAIFAWAIGVGTRHARVRLAGETPSPLLALQHRVADRLVFSKIRARTGGKLRLAISGSAALSPSVAEFLHAVGIPVIEGYGLTETSPVLTVNPLEAPRIGTVGRALPGVELRIAEDGEILARGPNVMRGYYRRPDLTAEIVRNGWLATGDIGRLDADGYLTITDRKKQLFKTSGGKYVAPQPLESLLKQDPLVAEAVVIGNGRKFVSALLVPSFPLLQKRAADLGLGGAVEALVAHPTIHAIFDGIVRAANFRLAPHEQIRRFVLLPAEFSVDSGELTPTLKVKRHVVEERWKTEIEEIYRS